MGRKSKLTEQDVLDAIQAATSYRIVAVPPSVEDVRDLLGVASTRTVFRHLHALAAGGLIHTQKGKAGIRLTQKGSSDD